jgi:hypothetical protein
MAGIGWKPHERDALIATLRAVGYDWPKLLAALPGRTRTSIRLKCSNELHDEAEAALAEWHAAKTHAAAANTPPPIDPTNAEILRLERAVANRDETIRGLNAKIKVMHRDASIGEEMAGVIRTETRPLPPIPAPAFARIQDKAAKDATPCSFVMLLSDQHADAKYEREATWGLERFDFDVFRCRLERLRDLTRDYATVHLPRHRPEQLVILSLGDALNGDIHGMGPKNAFANTIKAAIATGDAQAQMIQSLLPHFPLGVHVIGLSGNHARRSNMKDYSQSGPHDSYDYLVGVQMATRLSAEIDKGRCSVTLPNSWSAFVRVRQTLIACNHGDEVNAMVGLPFVAFDRRNGRVQSMLAGVGERADIFVAGHWHTPAAFASAGGMSYHSGSFASPDPYAITRLAVGNEPQQLVLAIGDKPGPRGVLLPIPIYLRDEAKEEAFHAGTFTPELGRITALEVVTPAPSEGLHIIEARRGAA